MRFPEPLVRGRLIRRYKRFLADVVLADGGTVTVHCPNPGSMLGLAEAGSEVWLAPVRSAAAKLAWRWVLVRIGEGLVGIDAGRPNAIVAEAIAADAIPELGGYDRVRREVAYGRSSRIDLLLEGGGRPPCFVEVKNVHIRRAGDAEFPDSVTARGTKHLRELSAVVAQGARAVMLYLVQRADCAAFAIAADIDPTYAEALAGARRAGVEALVYACKLSLEEIVLDRPLPLRLDAARAA